MRQVFRHATARIVLSALAGGVVIAGLSHAAEAAAAPVTLDGSIQTRSTELVLREDSLPGADLGSALVAEQSAPPAADDALQLRAERQVILADQASHAAKARVEAHKKAIARKAQADRKRKAEAKKRAERAEIKARGYQPGTTNPRAIAKQIMKNKFGYGSDQYQCFNNIIMRESGWNIHATNPSSGAYGIPQALPGRKMATVAADWRTNPATQITWGINYMKDRYGSPCSAWGFKSSHGWY